jgi:hypothetical protein
MDEGGSSASPETQGDAPATGGSPSGPSGTDGERPQPPIGGLFASTGWAFVVVGIAASLVVGIITASVVLALDRYGPSQDATDESASRTTTSTSTTSMSTTTTVSTTTTAPEPVWQTVASSDGAFELELPSAWAHLTIDNGLAGAGARMFPDEADRAALADDVLDALVTPQTRFVAIDASASVSLSATRILIVDGQDGYPGITIDMAIERLHRDASPGPDNVEVAGRLETRAGEAVWIEFELADMQARRYAIVHGDQLWLLTHWTGDSGAAAQAANRIVRSFDPDP